MFRAEMQWMASGPMLKLEGKLGGHWAAQAKSLITKVMPKGLIVDLTKLSYVDFAGERFLTWLGSVGAVFVGRSVYAIAVSERLGLSALQRMPAAEMGVMRRGSQLLVPMQVEAGPGQQKEKE